MIRGLFLPAVAIAGAGFGVYMSRTTNAPVPIARPVSEPSRTPFTHTVAGAGIVEARTENVSIGAAATGIVQKVYVTVGQRIQTGDPLFSIDDRTLRAERLRRTAALEAARARLLRLEAMPRAEELPPLASRIEIAQAGVATAQAAVNLASDLLQRAESVQDPRAMTREELERRRLGLREAQAREAESRRRVAEATATLELTKAGAWKPDLAAAKADVAVAEAEIAAVDLELERLVVRAPIDGEILKINLRAGELAVAGATSNPLILLGNLDELHVRIDVDEADIWRYRAGARGVAAVRGNPQLKTAIEFVRVEPWVVPKRSLTGDTTERVDTRVMQLLYRFDRKALPVLVGQQLDVFLEGAEPGAPPTGESPAPAAK